MKISIITVCYNSSKTILDTINSVNIQSYPEIEHVFVDGLSSDNTVEIINLNSQTKNVVVSERDNGLYDAINKGISIASGDVIGILHSDDIFKDVFVLENIVKFHQENDIDASVSNIIQFNKVGKTVRKYSSKNWIPEDLKIGFMPPHPSIFFKRELFEKYGNYHLDYISGADYELIVRFFIKHQISWKYYDITTTAMSRGGISSSGISSYLLISKEILRALSENNIIINPLKIHLRVFWKVLGFINK